MVIDATMRPSPADVASHRESSERRWLLVALLIVLAGCLIVGWAARHSTFTADDWSFVLTRRGWNTHVILAPDNEHLAALPILAFKLLLSVFGLSSYAPFIALLIVVHGITALLLYALARRYVGPSLALIPTAIFVVLGPAWHALLFYSSITFVGAVAPGLGMVLCLERRSRGGDWAAGVLLAISMLCSSVGLALVVLATVLIILQRPRVWRRLWAVAVPVALYLVWYSQDGISTIKSSNIAHIPHYLFDAAAAAVASVTGLAHSAASPYLVGIALGHVIVVIVLALGLLALARGHRPPPLTWAVLTALLALWVAEALEYFPNGREAAQSRYQYFGGLLVLLAATSAARGLRVPRWATVVLGVATLAICISNIALLHNREGFWALNSAYDRSETGALQITRGIVRPEFMPENFINVSLMGDHNLTVVTAGQYFKAVDTWGSSAYSASEILRSAEPVRESVDLVIVTGERLGPTPGPAPKKCRPLAGATLRTDLAVRPGGVVSVTPTGGRAILLVRRFAASYKYVHWPLAGGRTFVLHLRMDRSILPWHALILGRSEIRRCG